MDREVGDGDSNSSWSHDFVQSFSHLLHSKPRSRELVNSFEKRSRELVNSFEKNLARRLDELKPKNSDFLNLAWIRQATRVLSIKT